MKLQKRITTKDVTVLSMYVAIMAIMSFVPYVGYWTIGTISITTIPFIIPISGYHKGIKGIMTTSITFAVTSYLAAIEFGNIIFLDPVVAIVPRLILGILIAIIYKLLGEYKVWKLILLTALTIILNTALVTAFIFISSLYYQDAFKGSFKFWLTLIYINFIVEFFVGVALATSTSRIFKQIKKA